MGDEAAAWGRCVRRIGAAIDPNWVSELYEWMNNNLTLVCLSKQMLTQHHRGLIVMYGVQEADDVQYLTLSVMAPEPGVE